MLKNIAKFGKKLRPTSRAFSSADLVTINIDGKDYDVRIEPEEPLALDFEILELFWISDN